MPPGRIRVALVEDHAATRMELERLLGRTASLELVGTHGDAEAFLATPLEDQVDVALIDLRLPQMSGSEAIRRLTERAPTVRVLALTVFDDETTVLDAIRAGAYGYLLKHEPPDRLISAIEEAMDGGNPVSSRVAGFLIARTRDAIGETPAVALSNRERELAHALADGASYADCAQQMGIALGTVQEYVKRLYRKLNVNSSRGVREWVKKHVH